MRDGQLNNCIVILFTTVVAAAAVVTSEYNNYDVYAINR